MILKQKNKPIRLFVIQCLAHLYPAEINRYFKWSCKATYDAYKTCAAESCGTDDDAQKYYFPEGRYPSGDILQREHLR